MTQCCKNPKNLEETNQYIHYLNPRTQAEEVQYIHTCKKCRSNFIFTANKYIEVPNLYENRVGYNLFK